MHTDELKLVGKNGLAKGWRGFWWMLKILVPVSFGTMLLSYSGWIEIINRGLEPLMHFLHLPAMASLPLIVGLLTGIFGAIAAMAVLPLTTAQMTLIAIFLLIAHNLIQEGIVQAKSGFGFIPATCSRLLAAILTVVVLAPWLDTGSSPVASAETASVTAIAFLPAMGHWLLATFILCVKMFLIIMAMMLLLEMLRHYNVIQWLAALLHPWLRLMGLSRDAGFLWLTAVVFGLAYGGAIIVEETRQGRLDPDEVIKLQLSIGINHSMVDDPVMFLSLGLNPLLLWVPRLIAAIAFVWAYALWRRLKLQPRWQPTIDKK